MDPLLNPRNTVVAFVLHLLLAGQVGAPAWLLMVLAVGFVGSIAAFLVLHFALLLRCGLPASSGIPP